MSATAKLSGRALAAAGELKRRRELIREARHETADPLAWGAQRFPGVFTKPWGPHHRWLANLLDPRGPTGVRAFGGAPRGAGKSTVLLLLVVLAVLVRRSHRFVVVIRATYDDAVRSVESLRNLLGAHPWLEQRWPWLAEVRFVDGELHLRHAIVVARGAGSAIRGLNRELGGTIVRPDLVLVDDLETDATARSKLLTDRLERWLLGPVAQLAGPPGETEALLDLVAIGTTLSRQALTAKALRGEGVFASWTTARFPAEYRVGELGQVRALDVAGTELIELAPHVPATAQPGDRVALWDDGLPLDYLDRLTDPEDKLYVGHAVYAEEYLLDPQEAGSRLFAESNTLYVPTTELVRPRGHPSALERMALGVDPAASKRDAADYTALVAAGLYRSNLGPDGGELDHARPAIGVPYADRRRVSLTELLDWVEAVAAELDAVVVFEAEGAFRWGAQELRRRGKVQVRAVTTEGKDKRTRALPLTVWHETGRVHLAERLERGPLPSELHSFTGDNDPHDDLVDALVYAAAYATNAWRVT